MGKKTKRFRIIYHHSYFFTPCINRVANGYRVFLPDLWSVMGDPAVHVFAFTLGIYEIARFTRIHYVEDTIDCPSIVSYILTVKEPE